MKTLSVTLLTLFVVSIFSVNETEAGIFGRRKERIKAEVYSQLSAKLDKETENLEKGLAQGIAAAQKEIQAKATQQITAEANALEKQVAKSIIAMQKKAAELVAAESKRLQQQTETQIAQLQKSALAKIANESEKLQQQVADASKKNTESLRSQLQEAQTTLAAQVKAELMPQLLVAMQNAMDERLPESPAEENKQPEDQAVLTPEVRLEEETESIVQ
ncbi:MAG: hypothetical protein COA78_20210 [Blastopirellula sp.]|nr:MAG: hypothetical protein COA78_20210 [Blastopirellula sp.]